MKDRRTRRQFIELAAIGAGTMAYAEFIRSMARYHIWSIEASQAVQNLIRLRNSSPEEIFNEDINASNRLASANGNARNYAIRALRGAIIGFVTIGPVAVRKILSRG